MLAIPVDLSLLQVGGVPFMAVLIALILVIWANAVPVLARLLLADRWDWPVDGGACFRDGRPWLGATKTWRGWVACLATTPLLVFLFGLSWELGFVVALTAMLGDALASFSKRRLGFRSSQSALLLDQIPESLLPTLALQGALGLTSLDVLLVVGGFALIDLALTPLTVGLRRRAVGR